MEAATQDLWLQFTIWNYITWSNMTWYCLFIVVTEAKQKSKFVLTKNTSFHAHTGELWGVYYSRVPLCHGPVFHDITYGTAMTMTEHRSDSLWPSDVIWRQGSRLTLAQVMAYCLTASSHYLNQCWLMISEVLWHSPDSNFTHRKYFRYLSWKWVWNWLIWDCSRFPQGPTS